MKQMAIILALVLLAIAAWALFAESNVSIIVNGQPLANPLKGMVGVTGVIVGSVVLFCLAILFAFVLAGIWLFALGGFILVGLIVAWLLFPFLLLLLIPLALVWVFIALVRGAKTKT
ncbi:MAG TPA: hypothetical protein VMT94_08950 [Burkholderiales bacterium]|nr:hypothetical protein [Burkholderiales bacterium]